MEACWYCRLFYLNIGWFVISWLLYYIIGASRMSGPGPARKWFIGYWVLYLTGLAITWFVPLRLTTMFLVGIGIIILALVIFSLGYSAMREHPEKKKLVVDWGIYGVCRHSHVIGGALGILGVIVAGWNPSSTLYIVLWVYFAVYVIFNLLAVRDEEKHNVERFGQEYVDYMKMVPRFLPRRHS
jgi:protein-S-isoprenylcysteine O-methyltransferase Ste14